MSDQRGDKFKQDVNKSASKSRAQNRHGGSSSGQQSKASTRGSQPSSRNLKQAATEQKRDSKLSGVDKKHDPSLQRSPKPRNQQVSSQDVFKQTTVNAQKCTRARDQELTQQSSEEIDSSEMFTHRLTSDESSSADHLEQETDLDSDHPSAKEEESRKLLPGAGAETRADASGIQASSSSSQNLPSGWEQHSDKQGPYFWHVSTGVIQRTRPSGKLPEVKQLAKDGTAEVVVYHDDEEINQDFKTGSSSEGDDYYETGAALTADDTSESSFVVYPLGCCEFDETQLVSSISSTRAIQKSILRLSNRPKHEETFCWGLDQSRPILMKLFDDHIQFTDMTSETLLRSQPIQTIKTWAVDDNNNFAFVIEDRASVGSQQAEPVDDSLMAESLDYALLNEPTLMCYVFRSIDEDDMMSCKVATKLNEEINRYKEQMMDRITRSTRLQQMVEPDGKAEELNEESDTDDFDQELEATNEITMEVKYIGRIAVPRPTGIEVLNAAIDKCLSDATIRAGTHQQETSLTDLEPANGPLIEAKLHVSPSSVIVENLQTGEIIVECRIRYLTFMGISRRDIRWFGFIMQNALSKSFEAHCFECHPTAGHVCEAIETSCTRMYEKVVKQSSARNQEDLPESMSIIPSSSIIRNTLAKTFSRIKLNPIK